MKIKPLDLGRLISLAQLNEVVVAATYSDLMILFCRRRSADSCYYICNPFTKQWVSIPPPPPRHLPLIANEGFGFDLDNKCCKVVRILGYSIQIGYPLMVDIFSFETGKWIESDLVLQGTKPDHVHYRQYIDRQTSPVAHNGTLYWMTLEGHLIGLELFRNTNCRIRGRFIYNPNYFRTSYLNRGSTLCVYQGSVRVGHLYEKPASTVCRLYISELKEDDDDEVDGGGIISKLCLKELVDLQPCITSFPTRGDSHHLLAFDPKDEDIVYLRHGNYYSSNYPAAILRCNIRNKLTISHISNNSPSSNSNYVFKSFSFVLPRWRWPTPVPQLN